jgi:REP element-mobilizing transposase RayT
VVIFWGGDMPYTQLRYHIVFGTYCRRPYLKPEFDDYLFPKIGGKTKEWGGIPLAINGWYDHVHIVCALPPALPISKYVRRIKSQTSGALKRRYPKRLGNFRWARGYGAFTVRPDDMGDLIRYVRQQKQRHAKDEIRPWWEKWEED